MKAINYLLDFLMEQNTDVQVYIMNVLYEEMDSYDKAQFITEKAEELSPDHQEDLINILIELRKERN